MTRCPVCHGVPDEGARGRVDPASACVCAAVAPFPRAALTAAEWETLRVLLTTRSGGTCELRIPGVCAGGRGGDLTGVARVSIHHRQPRGRGGTTRPDVHSLAALLLSCGDGVWDCHGWVETHRDEARRRHLLVPQGVDCADVPLILPGGMAVLLDPISPLYVTVPGAARWV